MMIVDSSTTIGIAITTTTAVTNYSNDYNRHSCSYKW